MVSTEPALQGPPSAAAATDLPKNCGWRERIDSCRILCELIFCIGFKGKGRHSDVPAQSKLKTLVLGICNNVFLCG